MIFEEILEKVKEYYVDIDSFAYDGGYEIPGIGQMTEVIQEGGVGQGDIWYSVKYFPDHDVYIRIDGWYQSYNGTEFNGWKSCKEVRPQLQTITVYE